ncbi:hypothetical protein [Thermospira aquatica]|uniref:Uncharacterized protein n=1 Tax=Thermospira aquatica TaxID=2828656 RepID=A0AAX3BEB4_9SPIR|nr:hypothetical protein [Thermospira aquatica]URA10609.1 hypothetical protein KDW03_02050 [Thermospira aquatica]
MGVESYFVHARFVGTQIVPADVIMLLRANDYTVDHSISDNFSSYTINAILKLQFNFENEVIQGFSLEGCFACYDESLELCYLVLRLVNEKLAPIEVDKPVFFESKKLLDKEEFLNNIRNFYLYKANYFFDLFHGINFRCLPGKDFYKEYQKRTSFLYKIRSIFKRDKNS